MRNICEIDVYKRGMLWMMVYYITCYRISFTGIYTGK
jgi:hypothetical protein